MPASDAVIVGGDWISEHYLGSDAAGTFRTRVLERRKQWDADAKDGHATSRSRFIAARQDVLRTLASLDELDAAARRSALDQLDRTLLTALGYDRMGLTIERAGAVRRVSATGLERTPGLVIVSADAVDGAEDLLSRSADTLRVPYETDDGATLTSVARLLSHLFVADGGPEFALVLAGPVLLVAEAARWAEGRYLAVDLQVVAERAQDRTGGETDRALTCVEAASLAPDAEGSVWWAGVLEESIKHTVGVSKDLREGVRRSIEIIANEVVARRVARGLPPLPAEEAQPLARQSLRFLYRVLFLLYAEARPDLGVLPAGEEAYELGYSLDRLRELTLVELADARDLEGAHLYDSLALLFRLVDRGTALMRHDSEAHADFATDRTLDFQPLRADLFLPPATALIDEVGLGNGALQRVLRYLLLSKEVKGRDRGFISYAELGINQLGAVYEGLMSYTGFFATEDLYEVAKDGDGEKGSWVVPVTRAGGIAAKDFVQTIDEMTGERSPVLHERGTFVFRLSGRERQQSASYYTPEVLTRFTVSQALAELLDQPDADGNPRTTTAREVLDLTVCEPALGSGAFAIEAVRQLAVEYLRRAQAESGETIDPDAYPRELQKVKAYLALHQTYGVDLNDTAVEFAEISLWLDTMGEGLAAPWFGLHLKRGDSLIGARHAFYGRHQLAKRAWLTAVSTDSPLTGGFGSDGRIPHFLLPAAGWGSAVEAREARTLAPEALQRLKNWRKQVLTVPSKKQADALVSLGHRVEALWDLAHRRLQIAEQEIRRSIDVWGAPNLPAGGAVTRESIEKALADADGAYRRLRLAMDAWCALWFWPLTDALTTVGDDVESRAVDPPSLEGWIDGLTALLGTHVEAGVTGSGRNWRGGDAVLTADADWNELATLEELDRTFAGAHAVERVLREHPWLTVVQRIATQQGFFHWELDFAPVFAARGGFDLQVGNPPWVRPDWDEAAALAEFDVAWALRGKLTTAEADRRRTAIFADDSARSNYLDSLASVVATREAVSAAPDYPLVSGLRPDLYRCFIEQTWRHQSTMGVTGLIHLESHFTDEKAGRLRAAIYGRLRRHWQFINELQLFEIQHQKRYGVNVYGSSRAVNFVQAASLYHPDTVTRSLVHDGSGAEPGIKDVAGDWDLTPHASRVVSVSEAVLGTWHELLEASNVPALEARMVYAVNRSTEAVLAKLAAAQRVGTLGLVFSQGWNETTDFKAGYFHKDWGKPNAWCDAILQGPHLYVAAPLYKAPNSTMLHHLDWTSTDLEDLAPDAIPETSYKPRGERSRYDAAYTHWTREVVLGADGQPVGPLPAVDPRWIRATETATRADGTTVRTETISARGFYRLAWRNMAANTGERTFIPAIIPPGTAHIHGVSSASSPTDSRAIALLGGVAASIVHDFAVRVAPKSTISATTVNRLPWVGETFTSEILLRTLRLTCVTDAYADLWTECYDPAFGNDTWSGLPHHSGWDDLGDVGPQWTPEIPLRRDEDRRQALLEIDALVALSLSLTADELCTIYRTQFPVLYGYDRNRDHYDANGRIVPNSVLTTWRKRGKNEGRYSDDDLSAVHAGSGVEYVYELPFETLDREAHLRQAYEVFEERLS